jgi:hypothetical protein
MSASTEKEILVCEKCGAELAIIKPCLCPHKSPKVHSNLCCGSEMKRLIETKKRASK